MKRAMLTLGLAAVVATPAARSGWASRCGTAPRAGPGSRSAVTTPSRTVITARATPWGGRASLGIGTITLTAGVARWKPEAATEGFTSIGGNAAFRLIGGSLLPFSVNLAGRRGAHRFRQFHARPDRSHGAVGFSVPLPTPGISIEPYFSPGIRYRSVSGGGNSTEFGYVFGANLSFGLVGVHLAYDNEKVKGGGSVRVFGVGAHVDFHLPLGM